MLDENLDIQDLKSYCRMINICPDFIEIDRKKEADIILTPYNYFRLHYNWRFDNYFWWSP